MSNRNFLETDDLSSEKGIDYQKLRDMLKAGNWKEADLETSHNLCNLVDRYQEHWLRKDDIHQIPCVDLLTIDRLWMKYSNERFGFSLQRQIYQSLGGTKNHNLKIWEAFGDQVGWRVNHYWLDYNDLIFSIKAPFGHLPNGCCWCWGFLPILCSHIESCQLIIRDEHNSPR